ncbi:MAG: hypothetical protein P1P84_06390 [Deferrisomatales bacterium]|nr:hypothetical protein [Deferrisomatales bacterium]
MGNNEPPTRPAEPAATIILVRQHQGGLQTYLLRRSPKLRFMAGMHVFPGGRVDPEDRDPTLWANRIDLPEEDLARRFGDDLTAGEALGYAVAAVRETYEEAGILLARDASGDPPDPARLDCLRATGPLAEGWLAEHAGRLGWALSLSSLARWSRWITPVGMKRRYDTLFLLAQAPEDQTCQPDGREADSGLWASPAEALALNRAGEVPLSPPTIVTLHHLQEYPHLAALEQELPTRLGLETFAPRLVSLERGSVIVEPWDPEFGQEEIRIPSTGLEARLLPAGEPFSRIWFNGELWRPIAV